MDTTDLREAYGALIEAGRTVAGNGSGADGSGPVPPAGEWDLDQILAHVSLVTATTITAVAAITAGMNATVDNRIALDRWTIRRAIDLAGGHRGLLERIRHQGDALCTLIGSTLSEAELDAKLPTRLLSHDELLLDQTMSLREIIAGLSDVELPGHAKQLLALV